MAVELQRFRGALALVGDDINTIAATALNSPAIDRSNFRALDPNAFHITFATKDEVRLLTTEQIAAIKLDTRHLFSLGVGGKARAGVYWVVIVWAAGQQVRKQLGLPPKYFHITLSSNDQHDIDKGLASLLPLADSSKPWAADVLDHVVFTLQVFGKFKEAEDYASQLIHQDHSTHKGFLRFGDAAFSNREFKLAMLSYARAYERATDSKVQSYCLKKLLECSKETEWGQLLQEQEIIELDSFKNLSDSFLAPWPQSLLETLSNQNLTPTLCLEPRQSLFIPSPTKSTGFYKLPRFFRWLVPHHFALMSTPRHEDDITALASPHLGIRHILTLTEETPLAQSWFRGRKIKNTFLPIPNYHPPSTEQMDLIVRLFDDPTNLPLLVHCGGGKGRAGTVAACYMAACGFGKPSLERDHPEMSAADAISTLRAMRPGSLETSQQEAFVSTWCSTIWKRQSLYPDRPSEPPPCSLEVEGTIPENADLFVLIGLPGSGKSTFCNSLLARNPQGWLRISQDDSGSKAFCETEIGRPSNGGKRVILDRCNTSADDRRRWLDLAATWSVSPVCIWFDYDSALCISRAQRRAGHPTLPPGGRVRNAVEHMQKIFVRPNLETEGFKAIVIVSSFEAAQQLVLRLSPELTVCKFPRTPHLIDVGAATEDDLHADFAVFANVVSGSTISANESQSRAVTTISITEKIDGANMGFSLSSDRARILVQNRSHYVNPSSHEQFKKLGAWLSAHEADLREVLERDPYFAERYILYGEWMYATHSIPYSNLPDWFLAYDLYDRSTQTFVDRRTLEVLLDGTGIKLVPLVYQGESMPSADVLLSMIQQKSLFYDGRTEGVYVKVEARGAVKMRGKVVRSDFIAGNEHWTKGGIRVNGLRVRNP